MTTFRKIITKEYLIQEYSINRKSAFQISKEIGCTNHTIKRYLDKFNISQLPTIYPNRKNNLNTRWKGYNDISSTYWTNLKNSAKTRNIKFEISIKDAWNLFINQNRTCALSGLPISFNASKNNTASLDRENPKLGYELFNVQWVHKDVNFMKQSYTNEEFIHMCELIVSNKKRV